MNFWRYVYTRLLGICVFCITDAVLAGFLYVTGAPGYAVAWAALAAAVVGVVAFSVGYFYKRRRVKRLQAIADGLDRKELLGEVLPKPPDSEERIYYDAMKAVSRAALTLVADADKEQDDYRTFIEQWTHELKTPLTAMSLVVDNGCDAGKLRRELERADNLTEEVLFYARSFAADRDLLIRPTDVGQVVREAVAGVKNVLIASRLTLTVEGESTAYTDAKWLCFILRQLLMNCAQYTPAGGRIAVTVAPGEIAVADSGIGIPTEDLPRVTERGFTGSNGRKRGRSTGMGLYIVDRLCKQTCSSSSNRRSAKEPPFGCGGGYLILPKCKPAVMYG